MGLREDIEELADQSGSFTASPAHVFRELRVILHRYPPEPTSCPCACDQPKHEARKPSPLTMIGRP